MRKAGKQLRRKTVCLEGRLSEEKAEQRDGKTIKGGKKK